MEKQEYKNCPYCGEQILQVAKKCKHCGEFLDKQPTLPNSQEKSVENLVVKNQEGFFLKSMNAGCVIFLIIGGIILFSAIVILYSLLTANGGYSPSVSNNYVPDNNSPAISTEVHNCTDNGIPDKVDMQAYVFENVEKKKMTLPGMIEISPREDFNEDVTGISFRAAIGKTVIIDFAPWNSGTYMLTDPSGKKIWGSNYYWFKNNTYEFVSQCNTNYYLYISQLGETIPVKLELK